MRLAELQQAIRAADPAAILVPRRVLHRLIQGVCKLPMLTWHVPHAKCFVVDRHVLFRHVDQEELELDPEQYLPATVVLLAQPSPEHLAASNREAILQEYWRLLFHANLHVALEEHCGEGRLTPDDVQKRIDDIGRTEFAEARRVLEEEGWLLPSATDESAYIEFLSVFFETSYFAANLLPTYFPAIRDLGRVQKLLGEDVDADALFARTRLADAPDPVVRIDPRSDESNDYYWKLIRHAERARKSANTVRAAIIRTKAARVAPASLTLGTRLEAETDLRKLTERLGAALQLSDQEVAEWMQVMPALLEKADQGNQPVEAALLFDLQKVCVDHERTIYALDLVEWALSAGKRPIMRPLPSQRLVRIIKHLRSATQRLTQARLTDADREHLGHLLQSGQIRSQERLRERLRPVLTEAINDVGLQPGNPPERTAFLKIVEELLDRIIEFGFLTFGDLRDAISRNQLKLSDPADAQEFVRGDPLLRLDRRFAALLDGVYRSSDFYLRWMERFTALSFGTDTGRKLTRYAVVPFGGAAMVMLAWETLLSHFSRYSLLSVTIWSGIALLGTFFLGLFNFPRFRTECRRIAVRTGRAIRTVLVEWPARLAEYPPLRNMVVSWPFQLFYWYLLKPVAAAAIVWWLFDDLHTPLGALFAFIAANLVLNSRPGKAVTEAVTQSLVRFFELLRAGLVQGLYRQIVQLFKQIVDTVQYVLFTVDEWLRYRSGDNRVTMVVQTILGVLWYPIAFITRFYMLVLIEPGFNPIKAPVSILFAKIVYPLYTVVPFVGLLTDQLEPLLGRYIAFALVFTTAWLLPDALTFLLWEMKGNWRLYRANRQPELRPVGVGPHGETVRRLLQPGFHSGTVPRLYSRLRQAERDAAITGNWRAARVYRRSLQEVEQSLRRLVNRELVPLLEPYVDGPRLTVGHIELASNRLRVELINADHADRPARLEWYEQDGWLIAQLNERGWFDQIAEMPREAVTTALVGLYKLAGIDIVREQVHANVPRPISCFDLTAHDLVLWLDRRHGTAVLYDLKDLYGRLRPRTPDNERATDWPVLEAKRLIFSQMAITWDQWVESWQDQTPGDVVRLFRRLDVDVLPKSPFVESKAIPDSEARVS
jgi:hypothetical protein